MEKENIYVLHTGQVYGWDREPAVNQIVKKDGVHLNNDAERRAKRIITERIDASSMCQSRQNPRPVLMPGPTRLMPRRTS